MARTAIATDSNSGITQSQAKELGVFVLPMPFFMRGKIQFEDIDLTLCLTLLLLPDIRKPVFCHVLFFRKLRVRQP